MHTVAMEAIPYTDTITFIKLGAFKQMHRILTRVMADQLGPVSPTRRITRYSNINYAVGIALIFTLYSGMQIDLTSD